MIVQPLACPGAHLSPRDLSRRWQRLTWRHNVVQFKGSEERQARTPLRCLSNFYDESTFEFVMPIEFCSPSIHLTLQERSVRCDFSEKAIMMCKAASMGDLKSYRDIIATTTPLDAKNLGKSVQDFDPELWQLLVCSVAFEVVYQKFSKIDSVAAILLSTGDSLIVEATRVDNVWGIGIDKGNPDILRPSQWKGSNVLGWALMEVRQKLVDGHPWKMPS